ncbi:hypothetical protein EYZ11_009000 [Aspergillus tanneri]|nr:hypothetical protein EYZ11_009000 [Aspergillus tanneri]
MLKDGVRVVECSKCIGGDATSRHWSSSGRRGRELKRSLSTGSGSVIAIELFRGSDEFDSDKPKTKDISCLPLIDRVPTSELQAQQKSRLEHHFVGIRYNRLSLVLPDCREPGWNWRLNESFCTLAAFKEIANRVHAGKLEESPHDKPGRIGFP